MPLGLIRNTRPLDCSAPKIWEGLLPVTRVRTALAASGWRKRVTSPGLMENPCQLMIVPRVLVISRVLALGLANVALPLTTVGAVGLAEAGVDQLAKVRAMRAIATFAEYFMFL